jgi:hypothetical protein
MKKAFVVYFFYYYFFCLHSTVHVKSKKNIKILNEIEDLEFVLFGICFPSYYTILKSQNYSYMHKKNDCTTLWL